MTAERPDILPDGSYPFAEGEYPLAELAFAEAPAELETLLRRVAAETGTAIIRDRVVELVCRMPDGRDPKFVVWWPSGGERLHILTPKALISGRG